jgi:hypothetical protein
MSHIEILGLWSGPPTACPAVDLPRSYFEAVLNYPVIVVAACDLIFVGLPKAILLLFMSFLKPI